MLLTVNRLILIPVKSGQFNDSKLYILPYVDYCYQIDVIYNIQNYLYGRSFYCKMSIVQ